MALPKKVYGLKIAISARIFSVYGIFDYHPKNRKPLRPNQKLETSLDFN